LMKEFQIGLNLLLFPMATSNTLESKTTLI
jgi:hypothetical protein